MAVTFTPAPPSPTPTNTSTQPAPTPATPTAALLDVSVTAEVVDQPGVAWIKVPLAITLCTTRVGRGGMGVPAMAGDRGRG